MIGKVIGSLLIAAGIVAGAYVSVWVFLVGGIMEFIRGISAHPVSAHDIAWGIAKAGFLWETAGTVTFFVVGGIGALFLGWGFRKSF